MGGHKVRVLCAAVLLAALAGDARADTWTAFDALVTAGEADDGLGEELLRAQAIVDGIAEKRPDDSRLEQQQERLAQARRAKADLLVARAAEATKSKKYSESIELLWAAKALVPADADVAAQHKKILRLEVDRLLKQARAAAKRSDLERALFLVDQASALAPGDKKVAKAVKRITKRLGTDQVEAFRDDQERRAEQAAIRAAEATARQVKLARIRAEAEVKRRATAKAIAERDRRHAAETKRLSSESDKVRTKRETQARGMAVGTHVVRYKVADEHAGDNLRFDMSFPQGCTTKLKTVRKGKKCLDCDIELVYVAQLTCDGYTVEVAQDGAALSVTCEQRNCPKCEAEAKRILAPLLGKKPKISSSRSCWDAESPVVSGK